MSDALKKKIIEAKEKYAAGESFINQEQGDLDLFKWLEKRLESAKERKYNEILVHLAAIGKAMEDHQRETIGLTISAQEVKIAVFLAKVFEDHAAIWFLQDVTMHTLRKTKGKEMKRIIQELASKKRTREEDEDEVPRKKQKQAEFEIDPDFEEWLNGEREFINGIEEA